MNLRELRNVSLSDFHRHVDTVTVTARRGSAVEGRCGETADKIGRGIRCSGNIYTFEGNEIRNADVRACVRVRAPDILTPPPACSLGSRAFADDAGT